MTGTVGRRLRAGFTLIELLVVLALIVLIAALAVAVANSGIIGSQKVVSGGDRASGWLLIAKMRALRDRAPRGVRFFVTPDPATPTFFTSTEAQYIEAPDPWVPNPYGPGRLSDRPGTGVHAPSYNGSNLGRIVFHYVQLPPGPSGGDTGIVINRRVFFVSEDPADITEFTQRMSPPTPTLPLGPGTGRDLLLLADSINPFLISNHGPLADTVELQGRTYVPNDGRVRELILESYPDLGAAFSPTAPSGQPARAAHVTYQFAFQESPRPLLGEPTLQLTLGTVIDCRPFADPLNPLNPPTTFGVAYTPQAVPQYFDVLFGPSGQVLYNPNSIICLWVRDADKLKDLGNHPRLSSTGTPNDVTLWDNAGDQILVTVYPKTGMIATHPIPRPTGTPNYDPYEYAKDGVNSGL